MQLINWTDEILSLQHKEFDAQHQEIANIINELYMAAISNKSHIQINDILVTLHDLCTKHFKEEEIVMEKSNYNGFTQHCKEHESLLEHIENLISSNINKEKIRLDMVVFLKNWFFKMIFEEDKPMVDFFKKTKQYSFDSKN